MNAQCSDFCVLSDDKQMSINKHIRITGKERKERKDGDVAIVRNGNSETVKCK